jgi:predicted nucleic acid-binding protein
VSVLDINAVSALMRADAKVVSRLRAVPKTAVGVPQPVMAEICYGIERLVTSKRRTLLEQRFDLISSELLKLPWTDEVSVRFGAIKALLEKKRKRIEDFDAAIAAHVPKGSVLVTANEDHMIRVPGLQIENWSA